MKCSEPDVCRKSSSGKRGDTKIRLAGWNSEVNYRVFYGFASRSKVVIGTFLEWH